MAATTEGKRLYRPHASTDKRSNDRKPYIRQQILGASFVCFAIALGVLAQFGTFPRFVYLVMAGNDFTERWKASSNLLSSTSRGVAKERNPKGDYGRPDELPSSASKMQIQTTSHAYVFDPNDDDYDGSDLSKLKIRKWGCERRNEVPFIFVHIGKAGGGSVRARLAASAHNYSREKWGRYEQDMHYYYPIVETRAVPNKVIPESSSSGIAERNVSLTHVVHKGKFASSMFANFRPSYPKVADNFTTTDMANADTAWKTYEKTLPCSATTPLGHAIGCPLIRLGEAISPSCKGRYCNIVYVGHNLLGSELHWLPTEYLVRWWYTTRWAANGDVANLWQERAERWYQPQVNDSTCRYAQEDPLIFYRTHYHHCVAPREDALDQAANDRILGKAAEHDSVNDWSPHYASMPVLRVTVMREPFSWLVSKFFWHRKLHGYVVGVDGKRTKLKTCYNNGTDYDGVAYWVSSVVLKQVNHLCGEDCLVKLNAGLMTLEQAEQQARHNLQHSFAVVGLLNETQTFYDMVTARAAYMNTSLNPEVNGQLHTTSKQEEYDQCRETFQTKEFQENLLAVCPELRVLYRLYQVAVAVNRAQLEEMHSCGLLPTPLSTEASESES